MNSSPPLSGRQTDVLIVGAGPTGLMLGNLLGMYGVRTMLVEREASTSHIPKAILIDDEALRACQSVGLYDEVAAGLLLGYGARYYSMRGRCFANIRPALGPYGHYKRNSFSQPELERVLLRGLERFSCVSTHFETAVVGVAQARTSVDATLATPRGSMTVTSRYLAACDGGRSTVRDQLKIPMQGTSAAEPWLVVDTVDDPDDGRFTRFFCNPRGPAVSVPGRDGRRRYEIMLRRDEKPGEVVDPARIARRLAPWRTLGPEQIVRASVYSFHALMAERFQEGRVFLLGDAAHMMPPFAGQGMNAGIRDAFMLAWKLAAVTSGVASEAILETHDIERRPHLEAMTKMSQWLGGVVMTRNVAVATLRDIGLSAARLIPPLHRYIAEMRFKPKPRCLAGLFIGLGKTAFVGEMLPQPTVVDIRERHVRLDELLGPGWSVITSHPESDHRFLSGEIWRNLNPRRVLLLHDDRSPRARPGFDATALALDGSLDFLKRLGRRFLLIRPDRYVAASLDPVAVAENTQLLIGMLGTQRQPLNLSRSTR